MTYKQITRKISDDGWYLLRNGKGSHKNGLIRKRKEHYQYLITVQKEIGKGLLHTLLKDAGLK